MTSLDPTTGAKLSTSPQWWGGTVPIQHISFQIFASATSEALAFRGGDEDLDPLVVGPKSFAWPPAPRSRPPRAASTACSI